MPQTGTSLSGTGLVPLLPKFVTSQQLLTRTSKQEGTGKSMILMSFDLNFLGRIRGNRSAALERDDFSSNRHPALSFCLSMIFSENQYPLFRIML
jgi:hypothetical protein